MFLLLVLACSDQKITPNDPNTSTTEDSALPVDDTGAPPDTDPPDTGPLTDDTGAPPDTDPPDTDPPENTAPSCAITAPEDDGSSSVGESVSFRGTVADAETAVSALAVSWSSDADGGLGEVTPDSDGDVVLVYGGLSEGTHVITLAAHDGDGGSCSDFILWSVSNDRPGAPTVVIDPDPAATGDDLTVSITVGSADPEGDAVSYAYAWTRDGALTSYTDATVPASATAKGEVWRVEVTPSDAGGAGVAGADEVTIGNTAPTAPTVQITPGSPVEGVDALLCEIATASTDADGDVVSYALTWEVDGVSYGDAGDTFLTGDTVSGAVTVGGEVWTCTATPSDGADDGASASDSVTIGDYNDRPGAPVVAISPDPAATGDDLSAAIVTGAVDPEGDPVSYAYAWFKDGASTSYTGTAVPSSDTARGEVWRVEVTPSDAGGDGAVGSDEVTIGNTAPVISSVTLAPSPAYTDDTLAATVSASDVDGDSVSYSYVWYVNGSATGDDSATLDGDVWFERDDMVRVEVTPSDSDEGAAVTSGTLTISNTAPTAPTVLIDPDSPEEGSDDLVCLIETESYDADGDAVNYSFAWDVDGAEYTDAVDTYLTGDTVDGVDTTSGEVWTCEVTPDDGADVGDSAWDDVTISGAELDGKLVFLSSVVFTGDFGGVTGADGDCQSLADSAGHTGAFKAWLGGSSSAPSTRFTRSSDPYVLIDNTRIADDWSDLTDGDIQNPINLDEYGDAAISSLVYTNVRYDGTAGLSISATCYGDDCHCDEWTTGTFSTSDGSAVGQSNTTSDDWTDYSWYNGCGGSQPIYCFEQ